MPGCLQYHSNWSSDPICPLQSIVNIADRMIFWSIFRSLFCSSEATIYVINTKSQSPYRSRETYLQNFFQFISYFSAFPQFPPTTLTSPSCLEYTRNSPASMCLCLILLIAWEAFLALHTAHYFVSFKSLLSLPHPIPQSLLISSHCFFLFFSTCMFFTTVVYSVLLHRLYLCEGRHFFFHCMHPMYTRPTTLTGTH